MTTKIITFEGMIGSGKTTQMKYLKEYLESLGKIAHFQSEINHCEPYESLINKWKALGTPYLDRAWVERFAEAYGQTCSTLFRNREHLDTLVLDRYFYTPAVFQSEELTPKEVMKIYTSKGIMPSDITFIFVCEPQTALNRTDLRRQRNNDCRGRSIYENLRCLAATRQKYLELMEFCPETIFVNADRDEQTVSEELKWRLNGLLAQKNISEEIED